MTGGTLGTHGDPDLQRARVAAERAETQALTDALMDAGIDVPGGDREQWARGLAEVLAKVASPAGVDAAYADLKRAARRPSLDGR